MAEEEGYSRDEDGDPNDPGSFAYGQWSWQPGWQLPPPAAQPSVGNQGWLPPFPGYSPAGPQLLQPPAGDLQHMVETAVQRALSTALPGLRGPQDVSTASSVPATVTNAASSGVTTVASTSSSSAAHARSARESAIPSTAASGTTTQPPPTVPAQAASEQPSG